VTPEFTNDNPRHGRARAQHIPYELSSFVGREGEIADCRALVTETRLVTLCGPGGVGKTRLALRVASSLESSFGGGIYLVELASLMDPALVPRAVATALGLRERAGQSIPEVLVESLRSRKVLLVMDNCEHLIEACAEVANQLLRAAPNLAILATSREPLRVTGEVAWRVPSLQLPGVGADFAEIARSESTRLFVERVRASAPRFRLTDANAVAAAAVCRQLDGIPLALELAAARMKALSVEQLAERLNHRFQILNRGSRTASSRHQTLRATVDWSYSLLTEAERAMFRRLAVFKGGWPLEAAEVVASGDERNEPLDLMERLIDKSLLLAEDRRGAVRYTMLETLQEYGRERLAEAGETDVVRGRHLDWILELADRINPTVLHPASVAALEQEEDNLRSALARTIETRDVDTGLRLAAAAAPMWNFRGHFDEGITWLTRLLDLSDERQERCRRAMALKWRAILLYGLGDISAAEASVKQGYELLTGHMDECAAPVFVELLANLARAHGDLTSALPLYQEALRQYRELELPYWEAVTWFALASVLFEQGEYARSRAACEECLALGKGREFTWATSRALVILAYLAYHAGDCIRGEQLAQESMSLQRAFGEPMGVGMSLRALGLMALEQGHTGRAWSYLAESLAIAHETGDRMALARTLEATIGVLVGQAPGHAAQLAGAASAQRAATGTAPWPSEQARIARWLEAARRKLGDRAYAASWRDGENLSESDVVAATRHFVADALAAQAPPSAPVDMPLTVRQYEVAELIARGLTNDQIAEAMVISPSTARAHIEHILERLGLHSRAQIAAWIGQGGRTGQHVG
jgi:predicted ATPase/DNA-binding CsgD family transcriptional regulator